MPTMAPLAVKTGPPALPCESLRSAVIERGSTRLTVPDAMPFGARNGMSMAKIA